MSAFFKYSARKRKYCRAGSPYHHTPRAQRSRLSSQSGTNPNSYPPLVNRGNVKGQSSCTRAPVPLPI